MPEKLSITDTTQEISLTSGKEDLAAIAIKNLAGILPFGGLLAEILTSTIPNQKMARVIDFIHVLNYRIQTAERKIEDAELKTSQFTDLLEDAIGQASRAVTKERLDHIAAVLTNSITDDELDHIGKKRLLALLSELNDAEIIWLKSFSFRVRHVSLPAYKEFFERHEAVLQPVSPNSFWRDPPRDVVNKKALIESYRNNLSALGLIKDKFDRVNKEGPDPDFDEKTGRLKSKGTVCTDLGRMLLDYLDLTNEE